MEQAQKMILNHIDAYTTPEAASQAAYCLMKRGAEDMRIERRIGPEPFSWRYELVFLFPQGKKLWTY